MRLHYKAAERETIQYVDVMSLYPYICKYFKFLVGHPVIPSGDDCADRCNVTEGRLDEVHDTAAYTFVSSRPAVLLQQSVAILSV
jgi:hypothetical protein